MSFFLGMLAGIVWGVLAAILNGVISSRSVKKNTGRAMTVGSILRGIVALAALAVVLLLKNYLPFSSDGALLGTVIGLSMMNIIISYHIARS